MPVTVHDEQEFEAIVRSVTPIAFAYVLRRCDPRADAADVWQAVLVTAWRKLHQLPADPGAQIAWFLATARRELSHHRRTQQRRNTATIHLAQLVATQHTATPPPDLDEALGHLNATDREILQLTYWEQLTSDQIATVMGLSATAVRKRLQRARTTLRDHHATQRPNHRQQEEDAQPVRLTCG